MDEKVESKKKQHTEKNQSSNVGIKSPSNWLNLAKYTMLWRSYRIYVQRIYFVRKNALYKFV